MVTLPATIMGKYRNRWMGKNGNKWDVFEGSRSLSQSSRVKYIGVGGGLVGCRKLLRQGCCVVESGRFSPLLTPANRAVQPSLDVSSIDRDVSRSCARICNVAGVVIGRPAPR